MFWRRPLAEGKVVGVYTTFHPKYSKSNKERFGLIGNLLKYFDPKFYSHGEVVIEFVSSKTGQVKKYVFSPLEIDEYQEVESASDIGMYRNEFGTVKLPCISEIDEGHSLTIEHRQLGRLGDLVSRLNSEELFIEEGGKHIIKDGDSAWGINVKDKKGLPVFQLAKIVDDHSCIYHVEHGNNYVPMGFRKI